MCGIVAAIAQREVAEILLEGLRRLEYRGYDSAGLAVVDQTGRLQRLRVKGKVAGLADEYHASDANGCIGIAHTRWATHGRPSEVNAHPHVSRNRIAVVHNGIIENHAELRDRLTRAGYVFSSETDTEVLAHLLHQESAQGGQLVDVVSRVRKQLRGAYALAVIDRDRPDELVGVRHGSPMVLGIGIGEHYLASDTLALLPVTNRFIYLDEDDLVVIRRDGFEVRDGEDQIVERHIEETQTSAESSERGGYRHYMLKEIHEQPQAAAATLDGRIIDNRVIAALLGPDSAEQLAGIDHVSIVACGTSYHAGMVAKYWMESIAGIATSVEVASEYRYRDVVVPNNSLMVVISQSGETADTLAALRKAKQSGYVTSLAICNVAGSSLVREAQWHLLTHAGPEIGVASTKAFTTQLIALGLLVARLAEVKQRPSVDEWIASLRAIPEALRVALECEPSVKKMAETLVDRHHALFLGRGPMFPIALEGALKLKEISYIHAEAYPAGELKHGPLALVDEDMPVIAVAPDDELAEKLASNLEEVRARGGRLYVFGHLNGNENNAIAEQISLPTSAAPDAVVLNLPLQLLAYHVAVLRGTDVDQPRNLAKSVTVE
jgi:glucosamine--fructose-6-phosphate aminotransferase (isomerizing)